MPDDSLLDYEADFRSRASLASSKLLGSEADASQLADLTQFGVSLCLPASPDPEHSAQIVRRRITIELIIKLTVVISGGILLAISYVPSVLDFLGLAYFPSWPGITVFFGGCGLNMLSVDFENGWGRLRLKEMGVAMPRFAPTENACIARLEDPATYKNLKIMLDDMALLYCDAARSLILLEGVCYRYVIRAEDVFACKRLGSRLVEVQFKIANSDQTLSLAISRNSMLQELKTQLTGGMATPAIVPLLERTFGLPIPWAVVSS